MYSNNDDGIVYNMVDKEITVVPLMYNGNVNIPYGFTSIGASTFESRAVSTLTIPDTVTVIEKNAFYNAKMGTIYLGDGLHTIEDFAFYGCTGKVHFGTGLKSIGGHAFQKAGIGPLEIPDSVETIGPYAFSASGVPSVVIGSGVKEISEGTFLDCLGLESVDVGENVKIIGEDAFSGCAKLTSVKLREVEAIESQAFLNCNSLIQIIIPDTVTRLVQSSFSSCANLSSVVIGSGIKNIIGVFGTYTSNLSKVYYHGTVPDWGRVYVNDSVVQKAKIYYYSYNYPDAIYNVPYWHYDEDGNVVEWNNLIT